MRNSSSLEDVLTFIVSVILALAVSFYSAFVFMRLFNWFASPLFNYNLSYWGAYGIALIIKMCTMKITSKGESNDDGLAYVIALAIVQCICLSAFLGIGALVNLGM